MGRLVGIMVLALVGTATEALALIGFTATMSSNELGAGIAPLLGSVFDSSAVGKTIGLALLFLAGSAAAGLAGARLQADLTSSAQRVLRFQLVKAYFNAPRRSQERTESGALVELLALQTSHAANLATAIGAGSVAAISLMVVLAAAAVISPFGTALVVGAGGLLIAILRPLSRRIGQESDQLAQANSSLADQVTDLEGAAVELRTAGVIDAALHVVEAPLDRAQRLLATQQAMTRSASSLYKQLALALVMIASLLAAMMGIGITTLAAVLVLMLRALGFAQIVQLNALKFSELGPSLQRIDSFTSDLSTDYVVPNPTAPLGRFEDVRLDGVRFRYAVNASSIGPVTIHIRAGESTLIQGNSGSGKSTLAKVLAGLYQPDAGEVVWNGRRGRILGADELAPTVSYVPQKARLISSSVLENVRLYRDEITPGEVQHSLALVGLLDFVTQLPQGLQTHLGSSGIDLSGGQAQRLALARCMVGKPEFVVLDEPTSSLDPASEAAVVNAIEEMMRYTTVVAITHRALGSIEFTRHLDVTGSVGQHPSTVHSSIGDDSESISAASY